MAIFDDFITLKEAGSISGYHPDYIGALIRSNKVKGKKIGKNWFVSKKEVQEYFSTQHYAPVGKVFSGRVKVLFSCLIIALIGMVGLYVFEASHVKLAPVTVQSNLSDTVDTQDVSGDQNDDIAQPLPTISQ